MAAVEMVMTVAAPEGIVAIAAKDMVFIAVAVGQVITSATMNAIHAITA